MFLTNLSLKRPVLATVAILIPVIMGVMSFFTLNIDEWPDVEIPYISVMVVQPGAGPEQIEDGITIKVEEAIGQVAGVENIYALVQEGVSLIWVGFSLETEVDIAAQDVRDRISAIRGDLPGGIEEPVIVKFDPMALPVISLAVTGDMSLREKTILAEDLVKEKLESVSGVGAVNMYGAAHREIQVNLDKGRLAAYQLTVPEVLAALSRENLEMPIGKVGDGAQEVTLRISGKLTTVEQFSELPVAVREGVQLYVKDIATVIDGVEEKRTICRFQGSPAIGLDIVKQSGTNTVEVVDRVQKELVEINAALPPGMQLEVVLDSSITIREAVTDVLYNLVWGGLLAVLAIFVFLRSWRSTLIIALALPAAIIATFFVMKVLDFTLNTMSLMALSMAIGLLIDDAIVVIENINRHLQSGKDPFAAAKVGANEVGMAVLTTTLVIIAVFFPIAMMTGIIGQFFKQFGITVVFAIVFSLFMALTLVPLLASRHLKQDDFTLVPVLGRFLLWFSRGFERFTVRYVSFLKIVLRRRLITIGLALALFIGSLMLVPLLGSGFIPQADIGRFTVLARLDAGLSLAGVDSVVRQVEATIQDYPEVAKVYTTATRSEVTVFVQLVAKSQRERSLEAVAADMRRELNRIPGVRVAINQLVGMEEEEVVRLQVQGPDIDKVREYAGQLQRIMESIPGVVDLSSSYKPGKPEVKIEVQRDLAADLGVSTAQIAGTLHTLFSGTVVGQFEDNEERIEVRVRLDEAQRQDVADLTGIYLSGKPDPVDGKQPMIALSQVTKTEFIAAPGEITRFDRSRDVILRANLEGISLGEFSEIFAEQVEQQITFEPGYYIHTEGSAKMMEETFDIMVLAMITAILFIFLILAAQFESYIDPLAIMFSLPLAIVGAIAGLYLMNSELSLISMIGIVLLMGLAAKNGVLLIEFVKAQRAKGVERDEAILAAAQTRLRPIVMTATALVMGMLPLALGLGPGAEGRATMAHAVIGGLVTATLLTLVVVPAVYSLLDDLKNRMRGLTGTK